MESSEKDNIHVFRINRERPIRERSAAPVAHSSKSSKSRTSISGGTKRLICEDHMRNPRCTQEELATKYGCKRTTIAKIIKGKERWLLIDSDVTAKRFRQRNSRYPVIEDALLIWIQKEQQENSTVITDQMLQSQARMYAQTCEKDAIGFKASSSWLSKFKQRYLNGESTITTTTTTATENDSEKGSNSACSSPSPPPHIATDTTTDTIPTIPATLSAVENTATSTPSPNHVYHDTQSLVFTSREAEAPSQAIDNLNKNTTESRYHLTLDNNDTHRINERHTSPSQLPASSINASPVPEATTTTTTATTHLLEQQQQQQQQQEEQKMRDDEEMGDITGGYSPWQSDDDDNEQDNTRIEKDQARQHLEAALSYYTSQHQASSMSAELIRLILQKDF